MENRSQFQLSNNEPYVLKKMKIRGPIFRGKSCELFSYNKSENITSINHFKQFINQFMQINDKYTKNENILRQKHGLGEPKTEPRISKTSFCKRFLLF